MKQWVKISCGAVVGVAVLGLGLGTSSAKSLPTPDQTAVQAQRASYMTVPAAKQDALPAAYQSKLTEMTTEVRDYDGGFKLTIPWRVTGGVYTDKDLKGDAGHVAGYNFTIASPQEGTPYVLSVTKGDNLARDGVTQDTWNTTWYDMPIANMSKDTYLSLWRKNNSSLAGYDTDGDLFDHPGTVSARWDYMARHDGTPNDRSGLFEAEYIMKQDPLHKYTVFMIFPDRYKDYMENGLVTTVLPSFSLLTDTYRPKGDLVISPTVSFIKPKGFKVDSKSTDGAVLSKGTITLEVGMFPLSSNVPGFKLAYPTLAGREQMADLYVQELVGKYGATIQQYKAVIDNKNAGFLISGVMKRGPEAGDIKFASYITLTDEGDAVVARLLTPGNNAITADEMMNIVSGLRVQHREVTNEGTTVL